VTVSSATPIGLISNPRSGHNREQFEEIAALVTTQPAIQHITTSSIAEVPDALRQMAEGGVGILAINGGDGTASAILGQMLEGHVFEKQPRIVLLPGGTANMNAGDIGVRGNLRKATRRFLAWIDGERQTSGLLQQRSLLRVEVAGQAQPNYGMFLGAGAAVMHGTEYAHREIHSRGLRDEFSLALGAVRTVWGVVRDDPEFNRRVPITITLDNSGTSSPHDALILAISTLRRLFFGMQPFWGQQARPLRMTLIEQQASAFLRTFVSIARGRPNHNAVPESGYISHNAELIELHMEGNINLDGEIIAADGRVTISASPAVTFIRL
jgi:diacylglycerol kinase (ATP)